LGLLVGAVGKSPMGKETARTPRTAKDARVREIEAVDKGVSWLPLWSITRGLLQSPGVSGVLAVH
jgi:hypothetical protein